jgi:hypothetical protein
LLYAIALATKAAENFTQQKTPAFTGVFVGWNELMVLAVVL